MADVLPSDLAKVDPADAWAPYRPTAAAPWDRKWVSHLYRRAAFGPSPADVETALAAGPDQTLDRLMTGGPKAAEFIDWWTDIGRYYKDPAEVRVWWLRTMLESGHPLREKLTLFWHNHFATSHAKVRSTRQMFDQNVTLRTHALGKFRPFLLAMSRDVAMLKWLDSNQNVKGAPNENYAREVMELFSLGVGNYTEKDIQAAARAFSGWHVDGKVNSDDEEYVFHADRHDDGTKTVFGKTGNWNGDDVVRLCADQPACARFLVGKLYAFLVSETPPPKGLLAPLAERYRKSDYDTADLVRAMLGSRLFFSAHAYRKRVKWPVEYVLGAVRAVVPGQAPPGDLVEPLSKMGQTLFAPPNVKGWRCGTDWLNSATLLARNNFAEGVALGRWKQTNVRQQATNTALAAPAVASVADEPVPDEALALLPASPTPGGPPTHILVGPPGKVAAAAGAVGAAAVYPIHDGNTTLVPADPPPNPQQAKKDRAVPESAPEPDGKYDPVPALYATKPKDVPALVKGMGEVLYGEPIGPPPRKKIEAFLLAGKKTVDAKGMDDKAFKQRVREALHALMCLPEYQLG